VIKQLRPKFQAQPFSPKSGDFFFAIPREKALKFDETFLTAFIIGNRRAFGSLYSGLLPDYFYEMPRGSGVLIAPVTKTELIFHWESLPGDIDLIVIPYEDDTLVLDKAMAIEIKIIRASYQRQNKSPNEFGFTQSSWLLNLGFPYVALLHLVVSDESPEDTWEETPVFRIINDNGEAEDAGTKRVDTMPWRLTERAFGRLAENSRSEFIGLAAMYVATGLPVATCNLDVRGFHLPSCRACQINPMFNIGNMSVLGHYFENNSRRFFKTPRFDP
jgi:hypothetical protein